MLTHLLHTKAGSTRDSVSHKPRKERKKRPTPLVTQMCAEFSAATGRSLMGRLGAAGQSHLSKHYQNPEGREKRKTQPTQFTSRLGGNSLQGWLVSTTHHVQDRQALASLLLQEWHAQFAWTYKQGALPVPTPTSRRQRGPPWACWGLSGPSTGHPQPWLVDK